MVIIVRPAGLMGVHTAAGHNRWASRHTVTALLRRLVSRALRLDHEVALVRRNAV